MSNKSEEIIAESTPVVDLSKHLLSDGPENFSANDPLESWDNEKTEVYVDSDDDTGNAALVDEHGDRHPITAFPYVLGRGNECDFVLSGKGVSRKHAEIVFQSGRFVINDLQSLNGVKINGYKVNRVILEEDDVIKLGEVSLNFTSGRAIDKSSGKKKKPKKGEAVVAQVDDPFAASSSGKTVKIASAAVLAVLLLGGGYYFYQSGQQDLAQRAVVSQSGQNASGGVSSSTPAARQTTPEQQAASAAAAAQATGQAQPPARPATAPPPSLSMAPMTSVASSPASAQTSAGAPKAALPVGKETAPPVKKAAAPVVSSDTTNAKKLLASAEKRYLSGDADSLFAEMTRYENNSRVTASVRSQISAKHEALAKLHNDYVRGSKAHVSGNKSLAFEHWGRFMDREKAYFKGGERSVYADQVAVRVIDEYVERGNQAAKDGKDHEAYRSWQKALSLGESVAAKIAIETADARAKQLYRKALRLEYVNSNQAKQLWQEVIDMVPPGSEYHTKASSKLAWYERWGA